MIIIQATRVLSAVHFTLTSRLEHDGMGNRTPTCEALIAWADIDATSAIGAEEMRDALQRLVYKSTWRLGREEGLGWHDVL